MATQTAGNILRATAWAQGNEGGLVLFGLDQDGLLWCATQDGLGGGWSGWQGPKYAGQPVAGAKVAVADQGDGLLLLAMLDNEGMTWTVAQTGIDGGWGEWTAPPIGVQILSWGSIAAATMAGGSAGMQLMAGDVMGQIWSCYQLTPGGEWSGWAALGAGDQPVTAYEVALGSQNNGWLLLVAEGNAAGYEGSVAYCTQNDGGWGPWSNAGAAGQPVPLNQICAAGQGGQRGIQIWALDDNGQIWTLFEEVAGGSWSPWGGPGFASQPGAFTTLAAATQADATCLLIGIGEDSAVWAIGQSVPGGNWGAWTQLFQGPL